MPNDEHAPVEFDYIAQTTVQATESQARAAYFYLIAVGSLAAAM